MDYHPIQGGKQYPQLLQTTESRISSGRVSLHGSCATLPYYHGSCEHLPNETVPCTLLCLPQHRKQPRQQKQALSTQSSQSGCCIYLSLFRHISARSCPPECPKSLDCCYELLLLPRKDHKARKAHSSPALHTRVLCRHHSDPVCVLAVNSTVTEQKYRNPPLQLRFPSPTTSSCGSTLQPCRNQTASCRSGKTS